MDWSTGLDKAEEVWGIIRGFIPIRKRKTVAREVIEVFHPDTSELDGTRLIEEDAEYPDEDEDLMEDEE